MSNLNATTATGIDALARQLMTMFDRNQDGKLEAAEFTAVLGDLLSQRTVTSNPSGGTGTPSTTRRTDQLAGFDAGKLDSSVSTKYRFARAAMQFDVSGVRDKAGAEALLQQMRPAMEREGLQVLAISRDQIQVTHDGQPIWIDVIQGAGSGAPRFQWLPIG